MENLWFMDNDSIPIIKENKNPNNILTCIRIIGEEETGPWPRMDYGAGLR